MLNRLRKVEIRIDLPVKQRSSNVRKNILLILLLCSLAYVSRISNESTRDVVYRSRLCKCERNIATTELGQSSGIDWCSDEATLRGLHQKVVTYTIFGSSDDDTIDEKYRMLFKTIPQQVKEHYPDWRVRVYFRFWPHQKTERRLLCDMYCNNDNVDVCDVNRIIHSVRAAQKRRPAPVSGADLSKLDPLNWRFLSLLDRTVDTLMSRDADSDINSREVAAVDQWLESAYTFHVMRDHPDHGAAIMAGMFGAKVCRKRSVIQSLTKAMIRSGAQLTRDYDGDQYLLNLIFWPTVKDDAVTLALIINLTLINYQVIYRADDSRQLPLRAELEFGRNSIVSHAT